MTEENFSKLLKPGEYQVFLFTCPATLPLSFVRHPWFVVNRIGKITRWEIFWRSPKWETSWGHLYKDYHAPTEGIAKYFFSEKYLWQKGIKLVGYAEGELARQMAEVIESSPETYPYCYRYSLVGPNSNTYVEWVLKKFPDAKLRLPWNSLGKNKHV